VGAWRDSLCYYLIRRNGWIRLTDGAMVGSSMQAIVWYSTNYLYEHGHTHESQSIMHLWPLLLYISPLAHDLAQS